ncbi:hypothetical protein FW774_04135 (plasmid) [Pedobacter sp. BS3]|uniref:hypothetical protein n=1 Tax=Pedobacter sp. BS3 TaxID=2567937 RepID=UPI0011EED114|nr:hypothetical protein [Pedobacter sp. BS3]TZF86243.1 hypothetical protein FW774_04135 [Pedobacter sp. BS3]
MKTQIFTSLRSLVILLALTSPFALQAQTGKIANLRPYDQSGINVFETPKDTAAFNGLKLRFGAGFTQSFQGLKHENNGASVPTNKLYAISPGFNTANANLYMDVQLADGIRLNVTSYLSSRHHNETWVKGGYIQFDKLPFKGQFWQDLMEIATIKVGHMEINYGDAHFRRSDGGHTLYNPFVENYIMDAFTTEIGGEVYLQKNSVFGMLGVSNGMIKGNIEDVSPEHKSPSVYGKLGYDKQLVEKIRVRVSGSVYHNGSSGSNTLYGGDRTGSNYFMVMEKAGSGVTYATNAFSGRFNPGFTYKITAYQLNGFLKVSGLELFGTYEAAKGRSKSETAARDADQYAIDGVYRFGQNEDLFVGLRYNAVSARPANVAAIPATGTTPAIPAIVYTEDVNIDRVAFSAGWFITRNILLKGEYVVQKYKDFPATDQRNSGKFNGYVIQAVVGF